MCPLPPDIKWQPITTSADWAGGAGALSFELLNGRHAYEFQYFRGDDALATSLPVLPLGATPAQGHLALVPGAWDRVTLHYTTNDTAAASDPPPPLAASPCSHGQGLCTPSF